MKQQEPDDNILLSCPGKCSKDTYFLIKKLEKKRSMRDYVYVNFKYRKPVSYTHLTLPTILLV